MRAPARNDLGLFLLLFSIGAGAAVHFQWRALTRDYVYDEDLMQSPHWAADHAASFRPDDAIVEYGRFNESPVQNAIFYVGTLWVDVIPLSKLLAVVGYGLTSSLFFFVGRALYNTRTGFLMAMFFCFFPDQFKYSSGFFSKFWAVPLLLLCLYVLQRRHWRALIVLVPFAALAYPVSAVVIGLTCGVYLLIQLLFLERRLAWAILPPLAVGSLLAIGALGSKYLSPPDFIGPMTPRDLLLSWLEPEGKYAPIPPVTHELWERLGHPFQLASAAGFLILLRRRCRWEWSWTAMLVASVIGYVLADLLFARLYIPNRYTRNSLAVLLVLWNATNWDRMLERIPRPAWRHAAVGSLFVVAGFSFDALRGGEWAWNDKRFVKLCSFIRQLPDGILVAGPPRYLDRVMLQGRRSVLVPFLLDHRWYRRLHEDHRRRTLDVYRAIYAADVGPINELHTRYGVTHLVLSWTYFERRLAESEFGSRHDTEIAAAVIGGRTRFLLEHPPEDWILFDDGTYFMLELPRPDPSERGSRP